MDTKIRMLKGVSKKFSIWKFIFDFLSLSWSRRWLNCRKVTHLRFYDSGKVPRPLNIISKFAFFEKKMVNEISSVDHYEEIKRDKSKRWIEFYFISGYEKNSI